MRRARSVLIDLAALRQNVACVRRAAPRSRIMAVVKANAYGHGLLTVVQALAEAVDGFAVACLDEALHVREAGLTQPVLSLQGFRDERELSLACRHRVEVVVHHPQQLRMLARRVLPSPLGVWLKLDTGMHRLGFPADQAQSVYQRLLGLVQVRRPLTLMSHFACADLPKDALTERQIRTFDQAVTGLVGAQSLANSAAILTIPSSHRDWVRPGLMLYGISPFEGQNAASWGLVPVMTVRAPLISVLHVRRGARVGYGGDWQAPQDMAIGIVAIGYGDGYPRHAPSGTPVRLKGRMTQLIGRVSMDMIHVDLRGIEDAALGDEAVLWGRDLPVETVAAQAGTLSYELLCAVGRGGAGEVVELCPAQDLFDEAQNLGHAG